MTTIRQYIEDLEELEPQILESDNTSDSYLETRMEMVADTVYDIMTEVNNHEPVSDVRHAILDREYQQAYKVLDELGL